MIKSKDEPATRAAPHFTAVPSADQQAGIPRSGTTVATAGRTPERGHPAPPYAGQSRSLQQGNTASPERSSPTYVNTTQTSRTSPDGWPHRSSNGSTTPTTEPSRYTAPASRELSPPTNSGRWKSPSQQESTSSSGNRASPRSTSRDCQSWVQGRPPHQRSRTAQGHQNHPARQSADRNAGVRVSQLPTDAGNAPVLRD